MSACAARLVVNTSPLIHLAEAGLLRLLTDAGKLDVRACTGQPASLWLRRHQNLRQLLQSDLIEAFAAWGRHEATGRKKDEVKFDRNNKQSCADFALRYRAPLASAIFQLEPVQTVLVEFEAAESGALRLFDGRNIDAWLDAAAAAQDQGWEHVQAMVAGTVPLQGPLVTSATLPATPGQIGPIILWDGWHRAAAWRQRFQIGKHCTMSAFLILTAK